jgi:hypothetical protein
MHPAFRETMLQHHRQALDRSLRHAHLRRDVEADGALPAEPVVLRLARVQDDEALARLAIFSGTRAPAEQCVVAEVGGAIVAARTLGSGLVLADPFWPTAHLVPLLELRAKQIADGSLRWRSHAVWGAVRRWARA